MRIENGSTPVYTHGDHLGSPVASTDAAGIPDWSEGYMPFGETLNLDGGANDDNTGYTGHVEDAVTGLTYMQARYFDPIIGRFYSTDPIDYQDQLNLYAYVHNDPVNNYDPNGEVAFGIASKIIKVAIKGGDIGATLAGAAADVKTLRSGASLGTKALAAASLASEVFSPVSARDAKAGAKFVKNKLDCCFVAGTEILTERGMVPVEQIRVGDLVLARNAETGETAMKPVTQLFVNDADAVWELVIEDDEGARETHRVTDNHPYWVNGQGWVEVKDLKLGMEIATEDGDPVILSSIRNTGEVQRTFNFEVADFHTYFVGEQRVLVHNCPTGGKLLQDSDAGLESALKGEKHAPTGSTPYDTKTRLNDDGSVKQVTTYDGAGRRRTQYDLNDGRRSEHRHDFEYSAENPDGIRSGHKEIDDIPE